MAEYDSPTIDPERIASAMARAGFGRIDARGRYRHVRSDGLVTADAIVSPVGLVQVFAHGASDSWVLDLQFVPLQVIEAVLRVAAAGPAAGYGE
jgi:hypothetical protein